MIYNPFTTQILPLLRAFTPSAGSSAGSDYNGDYFHLFAPLTDIDLL
jgi:hypothetical protein